MVLSEERWKGNVRSSTRLDGIFQYASWYNTVGVVNIPFHHPSVISSKPAESWAISLRSNVEVAIHQRRITGYSFLSHDPSHSYGPFRVNHQVTYCKTGCLCKLFWIASFLSLMGEAIPPDRRHPCISLRHTIRRSKQMYGQGDLIDSE